MPSDSLRTRRRPGYRLKASAATIAALAITLGTLIGAPAHAQAASATGVFPDDLRPAIASDSDARAADVGVELGLRFTPQSSGLVTAIQYYQGKDADGVQSATLWSARGRTLAVATFDATDTVGWRTVALSTPVKLTANQSYVVSYHAPEGGYPVTENALSSRRVQNGFVLEAGAGVYRYGESRLPQATYKGSNYLVDIVFEPSSSGTPSATATPTPTPTATATPRPTPTPTPTATATPRPTPTPSATATATPRPTPTPSATATPTPTPTATPTPPPAPAPSTAGAGWTVNAQTVGLAPLGLSCSALPVYTGATSVPSGTVISGMRVTTNLDLSAGNILIERSCIQPTSAWRGLPILSTQNNDTFRIAPVKVTIRDSELDGSLLDRESAAWATGIMGNADVISTYIHGFGSGIAVMNSGSQLDILIERNYVTNLIAWGNAATTGNHTDGFTIRDFTAASRADRQLIVRNNRFGSDSGNDTGAFFIQAYSGRIDNVLAEGNLLEGQGYQLALEWKNHGYSNMKAVNNRFTGTGWGASYVTGGPGWQQWSENYIYDAQGADGKGRTVRP